MRRDWLKQIREKRGMTQAAVARELGVKRLAVVRWEAGEATPSRSTQFKLAAVLGRKVLALFDADTAATLDSPTEAAS